MGTLVPDKSNLRNNGFVLAQSDSTEKDMAAGGSGHWSPGSGDACWCSARLLPFVLPGASAHGAVLPAFWLGLLPQLTFSGNTHREGPRSVSMVNLNPVIEGDVNIEGSLESDLGERKLPLP